MKIILTLSYLLSLSFVWGQTCNKLNHNCSNTIGLNTTGVTSNGGSTYACTLADNVLYSSSSSDPWIATDDIIIGQGNAATLNFDAKRASGYSGTCEVWVHIGGYCTFSVYDVPFDDNGWVQIGTFNPNTTCSQFGPFTVPGNIVGGQMLSYCIVLKGASSSNFVSIDNICVSEISGSAVPTSMNENFGTNSSGWYPNAGVDDIPYHTYKNASSAYTILGTGVDGFPDKAAYFYTGFDFCSSVSGVGIITKEINTSGYSNGEIRIEFKSKYPCSGSNSYTFDEDYTNYSPEIFVMTGADNGANTWTQLPVNFYFADYNWRVASYDISAYKNANVRFKIERGGFCGTSMEAVDNIKVLDRDCSISLESCGTITGETAPLQNTDYPYSVPAVTGATYYKWYVRHDGNLYDTAPYIVSGQGTQNPTINFQSLPATGVRVLCIPFDVDPSSNPDACYAEIGLLGVSVSAAVALSLDSTLQTDAFCFGSCDGTLAMYASGGQSPYTYSIDNGVSFQSSNSFNGLCAGNYDVVVEDANSDQVSTTVGVGEPPQLLLSCSSGLSICVGDTVQLPAPLVSGGTLPYSYFWTPATTISSQTDPSPEVWPSSSTNYDVEVTDANGCIASCVVVVTVNPVEDASFNYPAGSSFCLTGTDPLANITGVTGGIFSFLDVSGGPTLDLNSVTGDITLNTSDAGVDEVIYTTSGTCPGSDTVTITLSAPPVADFVFGSYCANDTDPFPTFLNGGAAGVFTTTAGLVINASNGEIDLGSSTPGTYTVTNTISVAGCATVVFDDDITIFEIPDVNAMSDQVACEGEVVSIVAFSGSPVGNIYSWTSSSDIGFGVSGTGDIGTFTASGAPVIASIDVTPTSLDGCVGIPISFDVTVNESPVLDLGPDTTTCDNNLTLDAGAGMDDYLWSNGDTTQMSTVVANGSTYWVTVSLNGCFVSDTIMVTRLDCTGIIEWGEVEIDVYPNPTKSVITLNSLPKASAVSIYDLKGVVVFFNQYEAGVITIDLSGLESGTYILQISDGQISESIRIMKQ